MLISFNLRNFKSFADEAQISLEASKSEKSLKSAVLQTSRQPLLPAVAIYGANASGKSNFLIALDVFRGAVLDSQSRWDVKQAIPVDPNVSQPTEPTRFEVEFHLRSSRYRYGFEAFRTHVASEWLYSYPKGRERMLFKRETVLSDGEFSTETVMGVNLSGDARSNTSSSSRVRQNSLFISALAQDNQLDAKRVRDWFSRVMTNVNEAPSSQVRDFTSGTVAEFPYLKKMLLALVRLADSNINDIEFEETEAVVPPIFSGMSEEFVEMYKENLKYKVFFVSNIRGVEHKIEFSKQSRGVKRMYLYGNELMICLRSGGLFVVDELESSMHPHVASQLLALFQNRMTNPYGAQILFTTHETRLLNLQHLRRDQIWFVEKVEGCSSLYSLLEFGPRRDENFENGYLKGRYGALPQTGLDPIWTDAMAEEGEEVEEDLGGDE